jgi:hypothetical protein
LRGDRLAAGRLVAGGRVGFDVPSGQWSNQVANLDNADLARVLLKADQDASPVLGGGVLDCGLDR